MSLDATVGGATSNAYLTRAEADAYFADRLNATNWTSATSGTKDQALITTTLRIDQEMFVGTRVSPTQALKWPRAYAPILNEQHSYGSAYYATDAIPKPVKDAVCEYALELLTTDTLPDTGLSNFKSLSVGSIHMEMNLPVQSGTLPSQVSRLLKGLRMGTSGAVLVRA